MRDDDAASPWSAHNGFRSGLPARTLLALSCNGEQQVMHLSGNTATLRDEQLVIEQDGVRRQHLAIRRADTLYLRWDAELHSVRLHDPIAAVDASHGAQGGLTAPMNGSIVRVLVEVGQSVEAGAQLVVLEAMKMEHSLRAPHSGVVKALFCLEGEMVSEGSALVELA